MRMFIGVDPHKLSVTIEVVDDPETMLTTGWFSTDKAGRMPGQPATAGVG
jgi:hypothetical protein